MIALIFTMTFVYLMAIRTLLNIDQSSNNDCFIIKRDWPISIASIDFFISHEKLKPVTILKLGNLFFEFLQLFSTTSFIKLLKNDCI